MRQRTGRGTGRPGAAPSSFRGSVYDGHRIALFFTRRSAPARLGGRADPACRGLQPPHSHVRCVAAQYTARTPNDPGGQSGARRRLFVDVADNSSNSALTFQRPSRSPTGTMPWPGNETCRQRNVCTSTRPGPVRPWTTLTLGYRGSSSTRSFGRT